MAAAPERWVTVSMLLAAAIIAAILTSCAGEPAGGPGGRPSAAPGGSPGKTEAAATRPPVPAPFDPSTYPPLPLATADPGTGPEAVSLPWRLIHADPDSNRIYISIMVPACNAPAQIRFREGPGRIVITVAGRSVPAGALCPQHVTVQNGYLHLPHLIGTRDIVHARVGGNTGQ